MNPAEFIKQDEIPSAPMEVLLATYARLTGRVVTRFASRAVAERRVADALMSSADQRGHLGVPRGALPAPTAQADAVALAAKTQRDDPERMARDGLPGSQEGLALALGVNPYPAGSLAAELWAGLATRARSRPQARAAQPEVARAPEEAPRSKARKTTPTRVRAATKASAHRLQAESLRAQVYAAIVAAGADGAELSALEARFGTAARGCVGKLLANGNIEGV